MTTVRLDVYQSVISVLPVTRQERERLAASAPTAFPCRPALIYEDRNRQQSGNRIEPCDMESSIDNEASQSDERKIRASSGLHRIGGQGWILTATSLTALEER